MNTSYGLIQNQPGKNSIRKSSHYEALAVFNALTLKEKCLYLMKISKRNTSYQALVLMGLTSLALVLDYLYSIFY